MNYFRLTKIKLIFEIFERFILTLITDITPRDKKYLHSIKNIFILFSLCAEIQIELI